MTSTIRILGRALDVTEPRPLEQGDADAPERKPGARQLPEDPPVPAPR
jgi:hypothetical protein